ncbi:Uncharacterised protein [Candidatus Venteria ishoeyi]|uniref:Uncharacterized protein n=1 Tax=Candidatus Venteria ishoeyi TaxID=1899563 RepID=A0A1H6FGN5_9GAMM|nr:Uncharacterised protein [Candidatus Venteria ishoeyi]
MQNEKYQSAKNQQTYTKIGKALHGFLLYASS